MGRRGYKPNKGATNWSNEFWAMPSKDRPATTPKQASIRNFVSNVKTTGAAIGKAFSTPVRRGGAKASSGVKKAPGALFNQYQQLKSVKSMPLRAPKRMPAKSPRMILTKRKKKGGLRPASVVVADEQRSSHQFYKGKRKGKKMKKTGGIVGLTNLRPVRPFVPQRPNPIHKPPKNYNQYDRYRQVSKKTKKMCKKCGKSNCKCGMK